MRFWHDQLFCKPARHGGVVAWHQDYSYWTRTTPLAHLTCWTGLDDSTRENGCVHYVPGSHRWPDLPKTGLTGEMDSIQSVLTDEQREMFKPVAVELGVHKRKIADRDAQSPGDERQVGHLDSVLLRSGTRALVGESVSAS